MNFTRVLAGVADTLARAQEGPRGLYRFGGFADLIYRDPATVAPIGGGPASATLDDHKQYRRVDPASGRVPALVSGTLAVPPPAGSTVLVTVNGRVGGASELFPGRPGEPADHFGVITPDFLWRRATATASSGSACWPPAASPGSSRSRCPDQPRIHRHRPVGVAPAPQDQVQAKPGVTIGRQPVRCGCRSIEGCGGWPAGWRRLGWRGV
jgi:hypothetical protein